MTITHILCHKGIGETLAVAYAGDTPVALFADVWDEPDRLWVGQSFSARLRHRSADGRGAFLETPTGDTVFMETAPASAVPMGEAMPVRIVAEARRGKHARVSTASPSAPPAPQDSLAAWHAALPGAQAPAIETAPDPETLHTVLSTAL
ncbi:MAG: hypothetical protein AAF253_05325, partial [Pseudomonadota bacterium]